MAKSIHIDRAEFREATLREGIDYLQRKADERLPRAKALKLATRANGIRLTLSYFDVSLLDLLREMSRLTVPARPLRTLLLLRPEKRKTVS